MAKGGLPVVTTVAPPPSHHPTCSNAMSDPLDFSPTVNNDTLIDQLPDLIHPSNTTPSSSEYDSDWESTVDTNFDISKFENFKFLPVLALPISYHSHSSQNFNMESDCKEEVVSTDPSSSSSSPNDEIIKYLQAISSQMVVGHQDLQNQLLSTNMQLTGELQKVQEEHKKFKQEIHAEMISSSSLPYIPGPSMPTVTTTIPSSVTQSTSMGGKSSGSNSTEFQTQMLSVLNDTFAKLSSVISDTSTILQDTKTAISDSKSSDVKTEWAKFAGEPKKFRQWYLSVMAQLSIAPWNTLYDSDTNSVVTTTSNTILNGKLYAKVIGALEGSALQHMLARKHLKNAIRQFILLLVTNFSHFKTAFAFVLFRTNRKLTTGRPFWFFAEILQFC